MAWSRQLLPVVALLVGGCGDYDVAAPGGGGSPGSGEAGTGGAAASGGASASGGNAPSGGAPTTLSGGCDVPSQQPLPQVTLPHDECQGQAGVTPPAAPGDCLLWTGSGYLTVFFDARGVVVASLGADGVTVSETVLSTQATKVSHPRLSRNGDEVLVVLDLAAEMAFAVLDLQGAPLSALSRLAGEAYRNNFGCVVTPSGDGWLVASDYDEYSTSGRRGILLSQVSNGGVVSKQVDFEVGGYVNLNGFAPGDSGAVILSGGYDTGGQFGAYYAIALYVHPELDTVSCVKAQIRD